MVHYRRNRVPGGTYFFTVALADRRQSLLVDHAVTLRRLLREVREERPFRIVAMAILPDHWHAVWTLPPEDDDYARRIQLVKARFTRHLARTGVALATNSRGELSLWQKRYWEHTMRDEGDLEAHVAYVHINPVKHGLVSRAIDWPYSTIHRYVRDGSVSSDWGCAVPLGSFGE